MKKERPVNLAINTIALPATAYASILHRVSGVIVWVAMLVAIVISYFALKSETNFDEVSSVLESYFIAKFVVWGFLTALGYYCAGTVKHIIQDFGYCEELKSGKVISLAAITVGILFSLLAMWWIWL